MINVQFSEVLLYILILFFSAMQGRQILLESGLSAEELSTVWDLADIDRNGQLDRDEWNIACHLTIALKQGAYTSTIY